MKLLHLFVLSICLVELYGQRIRNTNINQDVSTEEPRPIRTRGRNRFATTEETAQIPEQPVLTTTNRRASTRTRIHSNNPKAAADRRARPTESTRGYAVEEKNNGSPIDSFVRQSKPRVLTESRFDIPTVTVGRRPVAYETSTPSLVDAVPVEQLGFGSTARAILQARGEPLPVKTTTPVVDEQYLLNNFGSTIRSLAAASRSVQPSVSRTLFRNDIPVQRATPLRSEIPILNREDIPSRRTLLRGEPLPSLKGSDIDLEREPPIRTRNGAKVKLAGARTHAKLDSERRATTVETIVEDFVRFNPETEAPETVQGLPEESEVVTETQHVDISSDAFLPDEEDLRKTAGVEIPTPKSTTAPPPKRVVANSRRNGARARTSEEPTVTVASRTRAPRTRPTKRPEELNVEISGSSRVRINRRFDDAVVAESRYRGPSVFTAEQYQDVTARSRAGRRIDSRFETVPERINVDLGLATTVRTRNSGRRATTTDITTTDRFTGRDRNSRGRSRSKSSPIESSSPPPSRSNGRRSSFVENNRSSGRRTSNIQDTDSGSRRSNNAEEAILYSGKRENLANTREAPDDNGPSASSRRGSLVETPSRRRGGRFEAVDSNINERHPSVQSKKERSSKLEAIQTRNRAPVKNVFNKQIDTVEETTIYYGEKSRRTDSPDTITTTVFTTEKPVQKTFSRSRSRFPDTPPKIDESKLEVLPLFEREPKTVTSYKPRGLRSRSSITRRHSGDHMHGSATENDVKFVEKPTTNAFTRVTVTKTESVEASTSRARISTRAASPSTIETPRMPLPVSSSSSSTAPTTRATTTTTRAPTTNTRAPETTARWVTRSPPMIRESVVAEINQVTSKSTITRRKKVPKAKASELLSRGSKKADIKVDKKKSSEEDIGEEDNYPEPFKALIQAKKIQGEARPPHPSTRSATAASIAKITNTEKVIVTSAGVPRGFTTARTVTTSTVVPRRSQELNEIINDNENELDPSKPKITSTTPLTTTTRSTSSRKPPKFSEKPKYQQRQKEKLTKSTEKPRLLAEKNPTKTTLSPRKSYSRRASLDHHSRRKALRSTASPPSTTPTNVVNREAKFSAKFVKKESKVPESINKTEKNFKVPGSQQPKGLYSSKRSSSIENKLGEEKSARQLDVSLIQSAKPSQPLKKFNSSRYSSRYRSDISARSTVSKSTTSVPFYIPTIPTPAYVPTVPTLTPPVMPINGVVAVRDDDLGVEVISFDDPVNTIPSANLVNGEYLTTDKNLKLSPMVKDGTTEKPVSIIERIINSITLISTTEAPNTTTINISPSPTLEAIGNSAILKLATKKTTPKDKTKPDVQTNIIETITSEKPTTIIEKIRSSLSAIQTNEVESNRMARLLANEQSNTDSFPRVVITSTTSSPPVSTSIVSSTTPSPTTNGQTMTTTTNKSIESAMTTSASMPSSTSSGTTIPGTTVITSTLFPSTDTTNISSTTVAPKVVEILAIPGETRISKSQSTTTTSSPSTIEDTTAQMSSSTMALSTETIPPTLGEILNGRTVDALNNLINSEVSSTKAPNYKTLQVNQNSISSSTTDSSTITTAQSTDNAAPFTSPILSTEKTTFIPSSSDRLLSSTLISTLMPASTTTPEPTTQSATTITTTPEIQTTTQKVETTTRRLTTTPPKPTTGFPSFTPSTIFPTILTTLFPNLVRGVITTPSSPISSTRRSFSSAELTNSIGDRFEVLSTAGTTARPTTVLPHSSTSHRISTTTAPTTTTRPTTTQTTTQPTTSTEKLTTTTTPTPKPTTTKTKVSESGTPTPSTKEETDKLFDELKKTGKLKNLNEEQKKNLEEIEQIEKEQAELLKQLSLLTTMFGGQAGKAPNLPPLPNPMGGSGNNLANRIIAMAIERDKSRSATTDSPPSTTTAQKPSKITSKRPNSIQDQLAITQIEDATKKSTPSLEDVLKQYNLDGFSTQRPLSSTYGKTDEALLAALLKERGIGPTTPKILADKVKEAGVFEETPTTKRPKPRPRAATTTARPIGGRLMQGLNWLLDILDPPTTKKPAPRKPKPKTTPKPNAAEEELLTNQPTRIAPMVTAAPVTKPNLSQKEIQALIKQLEAVQDNPDSANQLDFSRIKSLQNLINVNEGVQVTNTGQHGATSRATARPQKLKSTTERDPFLTEINRKPKASTISTLSVTNSIEDDVELLSTTARNRVMPPVSLNPISGIDDPGQGDSMIRSNLLTAAVNVTRAISSFLGSAFQDAAQQVRTMFYSGSSSGVLNSLSSGSSVPSIASASVNPTIDTNQDSLVTIDCETGPYTGATRGFRSIIGSGSAMVGNIAQTSSTAG